MIAFLALGSNLGDRILNLNAAIENLRANVMIEVVQISSWLENPAVGEAGPGAFLNGVVKIETNLSPHELLSCIRKIENKIDPERESRGRKAARKIDIDILMCGNFVINEDTLTIPHPKMRERPFVMLPLLEIEPDFV